MWGDADAADANQAYIPTDEGLAGHGHGFFAFGVKERERWDPRRPCVLACVCNRRRSTRAAFRESNGRAIEPPPWGEIGDSFGPIPRVDFAL